MAEWAKATGQNKYLFTGQLVGVLKAGGPRTPPLGAGQSVTAHHHPH